MKYVLADTHAIVWYLFDPEKLSESAARALLGADLTGRIYISAITLVEVSYLDGRKSFPYPEVLPRLLDLVENPHEPLEIHPLGVKVVRSLARVPKIEVPDMPDRIVAATAIAHGIPLVSVDSQIRSSETIKKLIPVVWQLATKRGISSTIHPIRKASRRTYPAVCGARREDRRHKPGCSPNRAGSLSRSASLLHPRRPSGHLPR